ASTADHTSEKTLASAEVEVLGFSHLGIFKTEKDGTFRIPNITANSEFVIQVKADGYYPTQVVVPVFKTTGYVSVHLVSRNTVDTVTRFFTKRPQSGQKSLIVGRVFDPETRAPQSDQELSLLGRSNPAVYFNALPDTLLRKTTTTGSYAYFNVEPAFRSVGRAGSSAFHLIQTKPDSAYYIESGRGGSRTLHGKLLDPYRQQRVVGIVKIVGSATQVETNESGEFEISGIDLPPGVITFEVEAEGYSKTWHTVPWSTREAHPAYTFYLPESDLVEEARSSIAKVVEQPYKGTVLGGAQSKFFGKYRQCVHVTLENSSGEMISSQNGPYPLQGGETDKSKKLCLSSQQPGFAFYNLEPGEYILKWKTARGEILRSHVTRVGSDRTSVLIN
ncbi:hypothetical protein EBT16_13325, partial [bacterium]|nr:hypothetical protein [bacterium]